MIKLGKLTDYAIAVMGQLVDAESACSAHHLSGKTGIPEPTVAKVLKLLSKENLVTSERGAAGGYKLAKQADQVSIGEIITAMEGPIALVACVDGQDENCNMSGTCPTKGKWSRVNDAIKSALESVKLKDMLSPPACNTVHISLKDIHVHRT
jgi:FeS assembly SUF system regulator